MRPTAVLPQHPDDQPRRGATFRQPWSLACLPSLPITLIALRRQQPVRVGSRSNIAGAKPWSVLKTPPSVPRRVGRHGEEWPPGPALGVALQVSISKRRRQWLRGDGSRPRAVARPRLSSRSCRDRSSVRPRPQPPVGGDYLT